MKLKSYEARQSNDIEYQRRGVCTLATQYNSPLQRRPPVRHTRGRRSVDGIPESLRFYGILGAECAELQLQTTFALDQRFSRRTQRPYPPSAITDERRNA